MKKRVTVIFRDFKTKDVPLGYFRNHLLPNGLAEIATKEVLQKLEKQKAREEAEHKVRITELEKRAKELGKVTIAFKARTGKGGSMFGSVTAKDIETELHEKGFENMTVLLEQPLTELGEHKVEIDFGEGVKGKLKVKIEEEK